VATRVIRFSLDSASVGRAINEVKQFKADYIKAIEELMKRLTEEGYNQARFQIVQMDAVYTGQLVGGILGYYSPALHTGFVLTNVPYAFYVEYGTGVVGAANPHPLGGVYDVNHHGDAGWVYLNDRDGRYHWTRGMASRPFMYNTYVHLQRVTKEIANEVFGSL